MPLFKAVLPNGKLKDTSLLHRVLRRGARKEVLGAATKIIYVKINIKAIISSVFKYFPTKTRVWRHYLFCWFTFYCENELIHLAWTSRYSGFKLRRQPSIGMQRISQSTQFFESRTCYRYCTVHFLFSTLSTFVPIYRKIKCTAQKRQVIGIKSSRRSSCLFGHRSIIIPWMTWWFSYSRSESWVQCFKIFQSCKNIF